MVGHKMVIAFTGVSQEREAEFQPKSKRFFDSLRITASIPPVKINKFSELVDKSPADKPTEPDKASDGN